MRTVAIYRAQLQQKSDSLSTCLASLPLDPDEQTLEADMLVSHGRITVNLHKDGPGNPDIADRIIDAGENRPMSTLA